MLLSLRLTDTLIRVREGIHLKVPLLLCRHAQLSCALSAGCAAPVQPLPSYALFACTLLNPCTAAAPCAVPIVTLVSAGPIIELSVSPASAGSIFPSVAPRFESFGLPDSGADGVLTVDLTGGPIAVGSDQIGVDGGLVAVLLLDSFPAGNLIPFTPTGMGFMEADADLLATIFQGPPPEPNLVSVFNFVGAI